jgi:hypothetical protein
MIPIGRKAECLIEKNRSSATLNRLHMDCTRIGAVRVTQVPSSFVLEFLMFTTNFFPSMMHVYNNELNLNVYVVAVSFTVPVGHYSRIFTGI